VFLFADVLIFRAGEQRSFVYHAGLSFVEAGKLKHFIFVDEDLAKVGWRKLLPVKRAKYFRSYLCRPCKLYLVDYSESFKHKDAKTMAGDTPGR